MNWDDSPNVYVRRARKVLGLHPTLPVTAHAYNRLPAANQRAIQWVYQWAQNDPKPSRKPDWWDVFLGPMAYIICAATIYGWIKEKSNAEKEEA